MAPSAALRLAANLSWLFQEEAGLAARMEAAARAGFRAAELAFPYAEGAPEEVSAAAQRAGLELVLLNTPPGNRDNGDMGLGAVPGRQPEFREALDLAVQYAKELKCPRIHIMAGRIPVDAEREAVSAEMEATFIENLRYAADILAQENLTGLLEPINSRITDSKYFLTTPQQGHIQIAQVPGRHEPDSPGELNYPYLFQLLESMDYSGYIGCEYKPKGDTLKGLGWAHSYWESHGLLHGGS
ncbi:putative hydroxypyruvate isomerase isoform X2 [Sceloporus undulatus]|uniref:putative hydroxypyruvate isomerase isoform X2 n=1 Tax=Sceloporus undulatus TaxID=8520 RepID=UPI001C4D4F99|nr:putative hydroxypyruvate isomerase isoform X2 [Sceloporus undulatus]